MNEDLPINRKSGPEREMIPGGGGWGGGGSCSISDLADDTDAFLGVESTKKYQFTDSYATFCWTERNFT